MKELKQITDPDIIVGLYPWIKEMPETSTPHHIMLKRCLTGEYMVTGFYDDGNLEGVIMYNVPEEGTMFVSGIHIRKKVKKYEDMFWNQFRENGFRKMIAQSALPQEKFEQFTRLKKVYSVYKGDFS